ncbi:MAG: hypothetical protein Q9219_005043 [cf. Caloplaca sp. 3 TL-2023]
MASINSAASADTLIAVKLALNNGENRRFKLALRDLGANTLPDKLRSLLAIPPNQNVVFERFSDSAGSYIALDSSNPAVYKQLFRAAKAKLKLRIRATITDALPTKEESESPPAHTSAPGFQPEHNPRMPSLETVASNQDLLSGLSIPTPDPNISLQPPSCDPGQHLHRSNLRPKLPYDPCLSPTVPNKPTGFPSLEARTSEPLLLEQKNMKRLRAQFGEAEAPVPQSFTAREDLIPELASSLFNGSKNLLNLAGGSYTICCNRCDANISKAHWHCSTCNDGDYDLCADCINKGILCENEGHWLIKRTIQNGELINSTTETIAPKMVAKAKADYDSIKVSNSQNDNKIAETSRSLSVEPIFTASRTCNSCVESFEDPNFVTCEDCEDFDLCLTCFEGSQHGHHPSHTFVPACPATKLDHVTSLLCAPGRNIRHHALCDGCDMTIYGTRHKCLNCPDWDFCATCMKSARTTHPGHRFVPLNEPVSFVSRRVPPIHYGINCDGPLCKETKHYITGDRYKCAVCHDTDFCAKCEALPTNHHNRTHPLIKFKSPVRNVSVTTLGEKVNGKHFCTMGDQLPPQFSSKATETLPAAPSANAATQVQTVAEVKPTTTREEKPKDEVSTAVLSQELQAHFVHDAIADGSILSPGTQFQQVWTLRNPGPHAWPAGCSVRFVGGDNMFNVDPNHPSSVSDIKNATESNVINRVVEIGEEVEFTVVMRVPERLGKAISYWRLKAADGTPFGHKLWCDIAVARSKPDSECIQQPQPAKDTKDEESSRDQMIYPKLEKESPVSSTHEAANTIPKASVATPAPSSSVASVTSAVTANEEKGVLEEIENLSLDDNASTEDGFLTDEEFEMLDASEDDFAEAANGNQKK